MDFELIESISLQDAVGSSPDVLKFLHNTSSKAIAQKILKEGFIFEKYIENSTDLVSGIDNLELLNFERNRGCYGEYTIIIQISLDIANHYLTKLKSPKYHFSEVLSKLLPQFNADNEPVYILPEFFIKGYYKRHFFVKNPAFNPFFISDIFDKNLEFLLNSDY